MIRTQVYLTEEERKGLLAVAKATGKKQAELIREAVDHYLDRALQRKRDHIMKEAAGMWGRRDDLPDFRKVRESMDRS
jgi:predicted DNA-binding protein